MENVVTPPESYLTSRDCQTIKECLDAVVVGHFLAGEYLTTIAGVTEAEMEAVWKDWPAVNLHDGVTRYAVSGALVNLWGYPHGRDADWSQYISVSREEVSETLDRWSLLFEAAEP